jgi:hypothetical protein
MVLFKYRPKYNNQPKTSLYQIAQNSSQARYRLGVEVEKY